MLEEDNDNNPPELVEASGEEEQAPAVPDQSEEDRLRTTSMADSTRDDNKIKPVPISQFITHNNLQVCQVNATIPHANLAMEEHVALAYVEPTVIGTGSFGIVFKADLQHTSETVAIKKVLQDQRYKNRELDIFREVQHENLLKLKYYYYTSGNGTEVYLNLITEYFPDTLSSIVRRQRRARRYIPAWMRTLCAYQIFRGLNYLHTRGICHRDIKPQNILFDMQRNLLQICDFGSAKHLIPGQFSVSYICSRYYRAPELIFGSRSYSTSIDMWSVGCVLAELCLLRPLFAGETSLDQLVEIIKHMGSPSPEEILAMQPEDEEINIPHLEPHTWQELLPSHACTDPFRDLVSAILIYDPQQRLTALEALAHPAMDEVRSPEFIDRAKTLPMLFNFSEEEFVLQPELREKLIPHGLA
eukprot:gene10152-2315_t